MTMTTNPQAEMAQNLLEQLRNLAEEIEVLDSKLGVTGGKVAQRNQLARQITAENSSDAVKNLIAGVEKAVVRDFAESDVSAVAVFTSLRNMLDRVLGDRVTKYLDSQIPETPASTLSQDEKLAMEKTRSERFEFFKTIEKMLPFYDVTIPSDITRPASRRGSIGPRGPKWAGTYIFSINGQDLASDTKISTLSNNHLKSAGLSTKELRDLILSQLREQGVSVSETKDEKGEVVSLQLPESWSVTVGEKTLSARQTSAETADDTDDEPEVEMGDSFGETELS